MVTFNFCVLNNRTKVITQRYFNAVSCNEARVENIMSNAHIQLQQILDMEIIQERVICLNTHGQFWI